MPEDLDDPFEHACRQVLARYPEALGVAYKGLDCGCSLLCGVSAHGAPVGDLVHVPAHSRGSNAPVCLSCKRGSPWERVVREGLVWPGTPGERPSEELRMAIGRAVFGPNYTE